MNNDTTTQRRPALKSRDGLVRCAECYMKFFPAPDPGGDEFNCPDCGEAMYDPMRDYYARHTELVGTSRAWNFFYNPGAKTIACLPNEIGRAENVARCQFGDLDYWRKMARQPHFKSLTWLNDLGRELAQL